MKKSSIPLRCQRCALVGSCDYLKPLNCPHFREKTTSQQPPSDMDIAKALLYQRSKKFILLGEILAAAGFGFAVWFLPLLALSSINKHLVKNPMITACCIILAGIVAGFRGGFYSTTPQKWRHAIVLCLFELAYFLFPDPESMPVYYFLLVPVPLAIGAYLVQFSSKIPLINKLHRPYIES